jgi:hypothetical protein
MPVLVALGAIVLILVVINLVLTAGIVRRLRREAAPVDPNEAPPAGLRVDLSRDAEPWSAQATGMLTGVSLVALVVDGCSACENLHGELDAADMPTHLYVISDPASDPAGEYLATWHELESFAHPKAYPAVLVLDDGLIVASGHSLAAVSEELSRLLARRATAAPQY